MKKTLFLALALLASAASTTQAAERKISKITSGTGSDASYDHYIYAPQGQLLWVQSSTTGTRDVHTYNTQGQLIQKTTYSWIAADKAYKELNRETYKYDAQGQLSETDQLTNIGSTYQRHYVYSNYAFQDGIATAWHMEDVRETSSYKYDYQVILERDAQGRIATKKVEELDYDYPEDGFCAYESFEYTYQTNGDIDTETHKTYNYDYAKVRKTETLTYTYSTLDAAYAPTGLSAKPAGSDIQLSWNAVAGATAYVVTYDLEHKTVEANQFTASNIAQGDHEFTVQAIVDGEEKNAAEPITANLNDAGMLPAENLVAGTPRLSVEETDNGPRTFYIVPFSWQLPAKHSTIKDIRIYYTSAIYGTVYQAVGNASATQFDLKIDEYDVLNTDEEGNYTTGKNMKFYVTIVYGSGESEKSNVVKLNPYNVINNLPIVDDGDDEDDNDDKPTDPVTPEDAIANVQADGQQAAKMYNLAGQQVKNYKKGIVITNGKKIILN